VSPGIRFAPNPLYLPHSNPDTEEEGASARKGGIPVFEIRTLLHPTDFSERAHLAYQLAYSLARNQGARLIVLHVVAPLASYGEKLAWQQRNGRPAQVYQSLCSLQATDSRVVIEHRLTDGDPQTEILRVARETDCDLIVMGTHGRTGSGRQLMGSVAEQVVGTAPCPVLIVKIPLPQSQVRGDSVADSVGRAVETTNENEKMR
jgi:nucleotide-binding universal stress UspA family protein